MLLGGGNKWLINQKVTNNRLNRLATLQSYLQALVAFALAQLVPDGKLFFQISGNQLQKFNMPLMFMQRASVKMDTATKILEMQILSQEILTYLLADFLARITQSRRLSIVLRDSKVKRVSSGGKFCALFRDKNLNSFLQKTQIASSNRLRINAAVILQ